MYLRAAIYSTYFRSATIHSSVVGGQTMKTTLFLFSELLTIVNALDVDLLTKPHTMVISLTKRTGPGRLPISCFISTCIWVEVSLPAWIRVLWKSCCCSIFRCLRFESVCHFCSFYSESGFLFYPTSECRDWFHSGMSARLTAVVL